MSEPIHIISLGAGVQSSTMALMAAAGEITPMPTAAIFADTQDEPASVYRWLDWLEKQLPFPVYRVTAGSLSRAALSIKNNRKTGKPYYSNRIPAFVKTGDGSAPGKVRRYCTRDFKIYPILRKTREIGKREIAAFRRQQRENRWTSRLLAGAFSGAGTPRQPDPVVIQWIGISFDEIQRMKPSRDAWCKHRWPLIEKEMVRSACKQWMASHNFPEPPRSACRYCPYKRNVEWRRLKDTEPEEFALAVQFERDLQATHARITTPGKIKGIPFLHRSLKPLDQVDLSTDIENGQGMLAGFGAECEGMCGV
jgi:hypothetical protein